MPTLLSTNDTSFARKPIHPPNFSRTEKHLPSKQLLLMLEARIQRAWSSLSNSSKTKLKLPLKVGLCTTRTCISVIEPQCLTVWRDSETICLMMVSLFYHVSASCDDAQIFEHLDIYPMFYGTNKATLLHFQGCIK